MLQTSSCQTMVQKSKIDLGFGPDHDNTILLVTWFVIDLIGFIHGQ